MRATFGRLVLLALATAGALLAGPRARADEQAVLERLDAVLAAVARLEERLGALDRRLERIESRLADVEAFVQRLDERIASPGGDAGSSNPGDAGGPASGTQAGASPVDVVDVVLRNRRLVRLEETGDDYMVFDVEAVVRNLERAGRIRARFHLTDRFGTSKRSMEWTSGILRRGDRIVERDVRFRVTRTAPEDIWLRTTDPREIRGHFEVVEVLYGLDRREEGLPVR